jgi:hypothetical protein
MLGTRVLPLVITLLISLLHSGPAVANDSDIRSDFWSVLSETRDHLSQLEIDLMQEVQYFEDAAEHSRQGGTVSFNEYDDHYSRSRRLISCLDSYHAHPGTEKLWEVLKRIYGNRTLSESERLKMYQAANEVFDCARAILPKLLQLQQSLVQSEIQMD